MQKPKRAEHNNSMLINDTNPNQFKYPESCLQKRYDKLHKTNFSLTSEPSNHPVSVKSKHKNPKFNKMSMMDNDFPRTDHGSLKQYCIKGTEVLLRDVHYIRNDKSKMLMITVDNKSHQNDTYTILYAKDVCPFSFKDSLAFIVKAIDLDRKLKSMTFQAISHEDKRLWLDRFSINLTVAKRLLCVCIQEVEKRRFQLGIKKRCEIKSKSKIEYDTLVELVESIQMKQPLKLNDENKWTVANLERLIQLVLNEISQPIIPYQCQKSLRKLDDGYFDIHLTDELQSILNNLPEINREILTELIYHMERLSKYYLIIMSSPKKAIQQIRKNICKRLAPILFRLSRDLEQSIIANRSTNILYSMLSQINENSFEN